METDDGQREKERTGGERPRETRALSDGAKVTGTEDEPVCLRGARRPVSRLLRPLLRSAGLLSPVPGAPVHPHPLTLAVSANVALPCALCPQGSLER